MASGGRGHTIHMTQAESDRIRQTVQTRLKKCEEGRGKARTPREPKAAVSEAKQAGLMADMSGEVQPGLSVYAGRDNIVALAVGTPYAPSTTPMAQLKPISLAELTIDTHHHGSVLAVKRTGPVVPLIAYSWTVVEDDAGHAERLEVCLHKSKRGEDMLDSAREFKIKEPYFTINEQGEATIRVNHPSDLVCVKEVDKANSAAKYKDRGNAALKREELVEAADYYAAGLRLCEQDAEAAGSIVYDLHRNRARVNLTLHRLEEAQADGIAAITGGEDEKSRTLDTKAKFHAGRAAYFLGDFEQAKQLFTTALTLTPHDKDTQLLLRKTEARLREQASGEYDFASMRSQLSPVRPRVDAATFTGNTAIRSSPLGGRGLFATRDIAPGDIVLCEKAFSVVWSHEPEAWSAMTYDVRDDKIRVFPAGLAVALTQKLLNNPGQIGKVMDLYGDWKSPGLPSNNSSSTKDHNASDPDEGAGVEAIVDTFAIHDIICRNAFGPGAISPGGNYGEEDIRTASTGLWLIAASANHSCIPNTKKEFLGDFLLLRATKPISPGEEITHSYTPIDDDDDNNNNNNPSPTNDVDARAEALRTTWNFTCSCPLCEAERADGKSLRETRMELAGQAAAFLESNTSTQSGSRNHHNAKRVMVAKAEKISRALRETYDEERWKGLPRVMARPIEEWLEGARRGKR